MVFATSIHLQAELAGAGGGWTNITADVNQGAEAVTFEYGIRGGGPLDRIAAVGTMTWAMKNSTRSSGGVNGYYTPGHANARSGWEIGIAVRLAITYGGTTYYKFRGTLVSVQPDAGLYRRRAVVCVAHDWMDEALRTFIRDTAIQTNKRSDQLVTTLVTNSARRQPAATSYDTGKSTFAFALDNLRDERTPLLRALADITYSEIGYLYQKGDTVQGGTLKFENRHARPLAASSATFSESMFELEAMRTRDDVLNHVSVMIHPRKVDAAATTVLYELTTTETTPSIAAGDTLALTVFFRDATGRFTRVGASDIVTPVASTDYLGNSQADGLGSDLTASLGLVFTSTSNSGTLTFTNNHATSTIYLTTLQVRGKVVADRYELSVFKHNTASEDEFGENDVNYDMIFEDSANLASGLCDWILNLYGDVRTVISSMLIKANKSDALMTQALAREPGDKITITESMTGITSTTYIINAVRGVVRSGRLIAVGWILAPADQQQFWILEDAVAGILGNTTYLGFA